VGRQDSNFVCFASGDVVEEVKFDNGHPGWNVRITAIYNLARLTAALGYEISLDEIVTVTEEEIMAA